MKLIRGLLGAATMALVTAVAAQPAVGQASAQAEAGPCSGCSNTCPFELPGTYIQAQGGDIAYLYRGCYQDVSCGELLPCINSIAVLDRVEKLMSGRGLASARAVIETLRAASLKYEVRGDRSALVVYGCDGHVAGLWTVDSVTLHTLASLGQGSSSASVVALEQ